MSLVSGFTTGLTALGGNIFRGLGVASALVDIRDTVKRNDLKWHEKAPLLVMPTLYAGLSIAAGVTAIVVAAGVGAFLLPPAIIAASGAAALNNLNEPIKDGVGYLKSKDKVIAAANNIGIEGETLNSQKGFFQYTKVTESMEKEIKEKFTKDNKETIEKLNTQLAIYIPLEQNISEKKEKIKQLEKKYTKDSSTEISKLLSEIREIEDSDTYQHSKKQVENLQYSLAKAYQPYQQFISQINHRGNLLKKMPMHAINVLSSVAVLGMTASLVTAPLTFGASVALTAATAAVAAVGIGAAVTMFGRNIKRKRDQKKTNTDRFLECVVTDQYRQQHKKSAAFKNIKKNLNKSKKTRTQDAKQGVSAEKNTLQEETPVSPSTKWTPAKPNALKKEMSDTPSTNWTSAKPSASKGDIAGAAISAGGQQVIFSSPSQKTNKTESKSEQNPSPPEKSSNKSRKPG